jgi:hypothetical protein
MALFGQCIASAGTSLELGIKLDGPVHPGLSFPVFVRKLDHYNQTVFSDSSSIVQIRSEAGKNSSGIDMGFGLAAAISGSTIFELQGGSAISDVAVRPFIISAGDASGPTQRVSEAIIYAEGMDNETFLNLRFVIVGRIHPYHNFESLRSKDWVLLISNDEFFIPEDKSILASTLFLLTEMKSLIV